MTAALTHFLCVVSGRGVVPLAWDDRVFDLGKRLGLKPLAALGLVVRLYSWVALNRPLGDLTGIDDERLGEALGMDPAGLDLGTHLRGAGFIESRRRGRGEERLHLADWDRTHRPVFNQRVYVGHSKANREYIEAERLASQYIGKVSETLPERSQKLTGKVGETSRPVLDLESPNSSKNSSSRATPSTADALEKRRAIMAVFAATYQRLRRGQKYGWAREDWGKARALVDAGISPAEMLDLVETYWRLRGGDLGNGPDKRLRVTTFALGTILGHLRILRDAAARQRAQATAERGPRRSPTWGECAVVERPAAEVKA